MKRTLGEMQMGKLFGMVGQKFMKEEPLSMEKKLRKWQSSRLEDPTS